MAPYIRHSEHSVIDTQTEEVLPTTEATVWLDNKRSLYYKAATRDGRELYFQPSDYLSGIHEFHDETTATRKLVVVDHRNESGKLYPVVVAVQAATDSVEYVDCVPPTEI